ncbi:MAG: hypothetical protein OXC00_13625 [Acidimicrobiaceae bacterium]|nr:hypothetical protein [Acidimicrobiaceae bacterium]
MEYGDGSDPGTGLAPEAVEENDFATVRRGYEPESVRARLRDAAEEIRRLNTLVGSLSNRITELEGTPPETLESRRVAEALGDEAARVLKSATDAAQVRIERAEAEHTRIVGEAEVAAVAAAEEGRQQGRRMVAEARNVRERILADLAGKRHEHRVEVERLRVMRDRLLEALGIFRQGLDGWIEELVQAEPRAAAAAEQAGLRVAAQPEATVPEIEAEIATARLAGVPLDGEPEKAAPDADETPDTDDLDADGALDADGEDDTDATLEQPESQEAGKAGKAGAAEVRLYDVEAEADVEFEARPDLLEGQAMGAAVDAPAAGSDVSELDAEALPASDAEAIFARLRSITAQPVGGSSEPSRAESPATDDGATPPAVDATVTEPDEVVEEFADEPDELADEFAQESDAGAQPVDPDDLVSAARAVAVGGIARRLKRLVVDEQGDLLDAIRRTGSRAVRTAITGDTTSYTRAARVPMQDFASDIDVSIDDIDLRAAGGAIVSILVEPARDRLGDLLEQTDDPDELSSAVRSIYRESRSRRADAAAEAAFSAGWPEPIT